MFISQPFFSTDPLDQYVHFSIKYVDDIFHILKGTSGQLSIYQEPLNSFVEKSN